MMPTPYDLERHDRSVVPSGETQSGDKLTELWRSFSWIIVILAMIFLFVCDKVFPPPL